MKKPIQFALVVMLLSMSIGVNAQLKKPGITLGAGLFYANPKSAFKDAYRGGLGAEVKGGLGIGKTYLIATLGYAAFVTESGNNTGTLTYAPVKVGLKHYLLAKRIFVNGDVGVANIKNKTMNTAESRFTADIGAGVRLLGLEAGIYYDTWKNAREAREKFSTSVMYKIGYNITL